MFRPTSPQLSLLESQFLVPPAKRQRLERSWAQAFRDNVLPLIDEEVFRPCFADGQGRPNKSIRLLVGLELLKHADDLTDLQALDALEFNLQWQHALGVEPNDAHMSERTLHAFRHRLMDNNRARSLFEQVTAKLAEMDGLSMVRQRLDSTHVLSNIRRLSRLQLFTETVMHFLRALRTDRPELWGELEPTWGPRYLDREGYFCDVRSDEARRRLPVVACDVYALVHRFGTNSDIASWDSYRSLARLLREQCEVVEPTETGVPVVVPREGVDISGDSLQSPHDTDATYGHKGKGYLAHVAETCVAENPYQVITDTRVNGAHVSDQHATVEVVEHLQAIGMQPEALLADTGYGSGDNIVQCAELGTTLIAPVQDPTTAAAEPNPHWSHPLEDAATPASQVAPAAPLEELAPSSAQSEAIEAPLTLADFRYNSTFDAVESCPAGLIPIGRGMNDTAVPYEATFDGARCAECPLRQRCPTRPRREGQERVLRFRDVRAATATRQAEQKTSAFKDTYKLRSGIESTNAELKTRHGAGRLRVRGQRKVELAITLKALALNAKRAAAWHTSRLRPPPAPRDGHADADRGAAA